MNSLRQAVCKAIVIGWNTAAAAAFVTTLLIISSSSSPLVKAEIPSVSYPPNSWINVPVFDFSFWDSAGVRPILVSGNFVCGFHCPNLQGNCLFAISILQTNTTTSDGLFSPTIVWSANRNNLVKFRATLQFSEGDLMLHDLDGTPVWSTNTTGKLVSSLNLTEEGNLVLYGRNNEMVWQSFDHPTDTLVPGQALASGQKLTANVSASNSSAGLYSLAFVNDILVAFLEPDAQQVYYKAHDPAGEQKVMYINGRFGPFSLPSTSASQFIRLGSDGHLRAYQWRQSEWKQVSDLLINYTGPITQTISDGASKVHLIAILGSTLGVVLFIIFVVVGTFSLRRNKSVVKDDREEDVQKLKRLRFTRFAYDSLSTMTENFRVKLGEGGFGSVFYGSLPNSTEIAVKHLDDTIHVKKSFLAEVETLGSVYHINLVTLIGFCAEKSHRLLVYEYLHNGSLDRWIFNRNPECTLGWELRQKIIHDVAKGLAYLHHECHHKILHLDVKPQNILLDENFSARLADFGLSKLIYKDQSQVLTTMRGTPGYMAPEWSSATITEKVDVYSFGIVVLEILCGRKNVDRSQPEEEMHLLRLFTKKAADGKLLELVDKFSEDMQSNGEEVVGMMNVAAWCLQADYTRRPSMRTVLNVLEGVGNVEYNLSYDFLNLQAPRATATPSGRVGTTTLALPSVLSGPR